MTSLAIGAGANQWLTSLDDRAAQGRRALFVGNQFERKGGDVLLRAWPQVVRRLPDAELILVGPKRDPAPGFGHGVSWRGRVDRAELERLYRTSAAFVLPSLFEPWGHVFVEAMGFGLPCIGTDSCAMPELIEDRVSGRLVTPGDPTDLAARPDRGARGPRRRSADGPGGIRARETGNDLGPCRATAPAPSEAMDPVTPSNPGLQ